MFPSVSLRPVEERELPHLLRLMWDREASGEFQWFGFRMNRARELEVRWRDDGLISADTSSFLTVGLDDGESAGWVTWRSAGPAGTAEIGIALFPEHRGRGIGTEAQRQLVDYLFDTIAVHRVQAGTEVDNIAEQRSLERVGFRREGVLREFYFRAGSWRDSVMYGLLSADRTTGEATRRSWFSEARSSPASPVLLAPTSACPTSGSGCDHPCQTAAVSAASLPGIIRRGGYRPEWLKLDVIAGVTVAAMLVPQAMAYAELGGLPASAGFRAALVALPIYAMLGTSRHLGVGPEPGTAILAAAAVAALADGDPARYAALMATVAGLVGAIALVAAVFRLGFVADLLSKPVLVGYITGVGLTLLTSQLQAFTGVPIDASNPLERIWQFVTRLDEIDGPTLAIGLGVLVVILVARHYRPAIPGALLGLAGALAVVTIFDLEVPVVGEIEAALPSFSIPDVGADDVVSLLPAAAGVALIGFTDNILTARSISSKQGYEVDADRELLALGAMNGAAAFGGGFAMSSSASRSFVPASIGAKTQLSSLVTLIGVLTVLLVGQDLLAEIPRAALAAVIVAAAFAVIDLPGFVHIASISRSEAALAAVTCLAVITADLLIGVLVAVALSVVITLARVARPHDAILGEGQGLDGWIDLDDDRATPVEGLLVYRFDAPLFFANAQHFTERVRRAMEDNPGEETAVVLDMEGVGSIDTSAVDHLGDLLADLDAASIDVSIARANDKVLDVLHRAGLYERIGADHIFPTINTAVAAFRRRAQ